MNPDQVTFTPAALSKIKEILSDETNPNTKLRVFVQGGGCAGFQYGFTLDETVNDDDFISDHDGVGVAIDSSSMMYLQQAKIDFIDDLTGSHFRIENPSAVTTCGCGSSFGI